MHRATEYKRQERLQREENGDKWRENGRDTGSISRRARTGETMTTGEMTEDRHNSN